MLHISPSILSADFSDLAHDISRVETGGADWLHLDVMDGIFVPNISFGAPVIRALRLHSKLFFDVHLMIVKPERYLPDFIEAGADLITIHAESCEDPLSCLTFLRKNGIKAGIAISPETDVQRLEPLLPYADLALIMTVHPGFGGQSFMEDMMPKVRYIKQYIRNIDHPVDIEVDGGITPETAQVAVKSGANALVAGSSIFRSDFPADVIRTIKQTCEPLILSC